MFVKRNSFFVVFEFSHMFFWAFQEKELSLRAILKDMKLYKTLLFIFALLAVLACIAFFFPKEGVKVGSTQLTFPSLKSVLTAGGDEDEEGVVELTPEQLLEQRMQALMEAQDSTFNDFCTNSPIKISMPLIHRYLADTLTMDQYLSMGDSLKSLCDSINLYVAGTEFEPDSLWIAYRDSITEERDMAYLDGFFESLDSARVRHVRIMHYGDSQIEEDRITSGLREHFQEQFGGGGCGMMPAQKWVTKMTVGQTTSPQLPYYLAYGTASMRGNTSNYGPMATVAHASGPVNITFTPYQNNNFPHVKDFDKVTILRNNPDGSGLQYIVQEYDSMLHKVTVNVPGPADIYGVMLDQRTGVSMDNVPMRGSSGNVFTRISRNTIVPFYKHENVRLIILQYGGNSVPALRSEKSLHHFCKELQKQIRFFQEIAPEAKILFIGPSDMSTNIGGQKKTYPLLPLFVELLDKYMTECGVAFWNMFEAMGGEGSMVRWVAARPQLAGEDYVHFTRKGAMYVSDMLFETIDTYYKYYKFRRGEYTIELPTENEDSTFIDTTQHVVDIADNSISR